MKLPTNLLSIIHYVFLLTIMACDPCKNTNCQNNGTCMEGECACPSPYGGANCETNLCTGINCGGHGNCYYGSCACTSGYEGVSCQTLVTAKFTGGYSTSQTCSGSNTTYNTGVSATNIPANSEIILQPIMGVSLYATAAGRSITIHGQTISSNDYSGSGTLSEDGKQIDLTITKDPFGSTPPSSCQLTLTR